MVQDSITKIRSRADELIVFSFSGAFVWSQRLVISRVSVRILSLDKRILMPVIYVLCVIGSYLINYNLFDVKVMFVFGLVGIALSNFEFPASPFLLGVILGSMADQNLRRGLRISRGSLLPMLQRPICVVFLVVNLLMILSQTGLFKNLMKKLKKDKEAP